MPNYLTEEDIITKFINNKCVLGEQYTTSSAILYLHFQNWFKLNFTSQLFLRKKFDNHLKKRKFALKKSSYGFLWSGIRLICK